MMEPVRFSVIMNIYNGAAYLRASIDSVLAQTHTGWELILWDDASTDDSAAICAGYDDPRIRRFVMTENGGLGYSRNAAAAVATGEWIAFLDQDDLWLPDKLARQHALIAQDPGGRLGLVYGRTIRFGAGAETPFDPWFGAGVLPEGDIFASLLARPSFVALSSAVFRTSVLRGLGPVPASIRFCTDYYLAVMISRDHRVACVQDLCCRYRVHPGSMSHVFGRAIHQEIIAIVESAAGPAQQRIVRRRRRVHETWIGLEEFRSGHRRTGAGRILRHGSLVYLTLRPAVAAMRQARARLSAWAGKAWA